jgi:hypothetical protein
VVKTLEQELKEPQNREDNAALRFAARPGELGLLKDDGSVLHLSDYSLGRSFCSPNPMLALTAIADFINTNNLRSHTTAAAILEDLQKDPGDKESEICWFEPSLGKSLTGASWDRVIKYELRTSAKVLAATGPAVIILLVLLALHVFATNLYYRGFVYIVCGPLAKSV